MTGGPGGVVMGRSATSSFRMPAVLRHLPLALALAALNGLFVLGDFI